MEGLADNLRRQLEALWWNGGFWLAIPALLVGVALGVGVAGANRSAYAAIVTACVVALLWLATGGGRHVVPQPSWPLPDVAPLKPKEPDKPKRPWAPWRQGGDEGAA
jgi:hypothetical protein